MDTTTQTAGETAHNAFEVAIIVVSPSGDAWDSGVCTFADDEQVTVEVPAGWRVFSRYGDAREDEPLPYGVRFVSLASIRKQGAIVTIA